LRFFFDAERHLYFLDGRLLPSVTDILKEAGLLVYPGTNEYQKQRGSYVHKATELIDIGMLHWEGLDRALRPYCDGYVRFLGETGFEPLMTERSLYHPGLLYAGTIDRIGVLEGSRVIVDIKTGVPHPATEIQLAAYSELARPHVPVDRCLALYLRPDGSYSLVEARDEARSFNVFVAALSIVRWRRENL
jgi:hypothetical protein